MSAPAAVVVERRDLEALKGETPLLARDLAARGFVAVLTVSAGWRAGMAYETKRGAIVHVAGSRAVVERYARELRAGVRPC